MGIMRPLTTVRRSVLLSILVVMMSLLGASHAGALTNCEKYYAIEFDCTALQELRYCLDIASRDFEDCEDEHIWMEEIFVCPPRYHFNILACGLSSPFTFFM